LIPHCILTVPMIPHCTLTVLLIQPCNVDPAMHPHCTFDPASTPLKHRLLQLPSHPDHSVSFLLPCSLFLQAVLPADKATSTKPWFTQTQSQRIASLVTYCSQRQLTSLSAYKFETLSTCPYLSFLHSTKPWFTSDQVCTHCSSCDMSLAKTFDTAVSIRF